MDFINKAISSVQPSDEPKPDPPATGNHSTTELIANAKDVAGAYPGRVAGAAADMIVAAKEGVGQSVGQAETYLRSYGTSGEKDVEEKKKDAGIGGLFSK